MLYIITFQIFNDFVTVETFSLPKYIKEVKAKQNKMKPLWSQDVIPLTGPSDHNENNENVVLKQVRSKLMKSIYAVDGNSIRKARKIIQQPPPDTHTHKLIFRIKKLTPPTF